MAAVRSSRNFEGQPLVGPPTARGRSPGWRCSTAHLRRAALAHLVGALLVDLEAVADVEHLVGREALALQDVAGGVGAVAVLEAALAGVVGGLHAGVARRRRRRVVERAGDALAVVGVADRLVRIDERAAVGREHGAAAAHPGVGAERLLGVDVHALDVRLRRSVGLHGVAGPVVETSLSGWWSSSGPWCSRGLVGPLWGWWWCPSAGTHFCSGEQLEAIVAGAALRARAPRSPMGHWVAGGAHRLSLSARRRVGVRVRSSGGRRRRTGAEDDRVEARNVTQDQARGERMASSIIAHPPGPDNRRPRSAATEPRIHGAPLNEQSGGYRRLRPPLPAGKPARRRTTSKAAAWLRRSWARRWGSPRRR